MGYEPGGSRALLRKVGTPGLGSGGSWSSDSGIQGQSPRWAPCGVQPGRGWPAWHLPGRRACGAGEGAVGWAPCRGVCVVSPELSDHAPSEPPRGRQGPGGALFCGPGLTQGCRAGRLVPVRCGAWQGAPCRPPRPARPCQVGCPRGLAARPCCSGQRRLRGGCWRPLAPEVRAGRWASLGRVLRSVSPEP